MPDVEIAIGGKLFSVACQEGEEVYLQSAAQLLDGEAQVLADQLGRMTAERMLLMAGLMLSDNQMANPESSALLAGMYVVTMAEPSRDLLASTDTWGKRARDLSACEAVLRAAKLRYARMRDRWVAWSLLPPELFPQYESEWKKSLETHAMQADPLIGLVHMLTPAVDAAMRAGLRTEQLHHWLITIEAIRLHAGETGELPESLDRLQPVPAWNDSIARRTFGYQRSTPNSARLTRVPRYRDDPATSFQIELKGSE